MRPREAFAILCISASVSASDTKHIEPSQVSFIYRGIPLKGTVIIGDTYIILNDGQKYLSATGHIIPLKESSTKIDGQNLLVISQTNGEIVEFSDINEHASQLRTSRISNDIVNV